MVYLGTAILVLLVICGILVWRVRRLEILLVRMGRLVRLQGTASLAALVTLNALAGPPEPCKGCGALVRPGAWKGLCILCVVEKENRTEAGPQKGEAKQSNE